MSTPTNGWLHDAQAGVDVRTGPVQGRPAPAPQAEGPYDWEAEDSDFERPARPARPARAPRQTPRQSAPADPGWDEDDDDDDYRRAPAAPRQQRASRGASVAGAVGTAAGAAAGAFVGGAAGSFVPPVSVTVNRGNGNGGGRNGGGGRGTAAPADGAGSSGAFHQGDRLIYAVERIEIRSDRDILALAKAINRLGRELHLILGMRAEEVQGVLSTYKGRWYTFGTGSRVRARLVAAHLRVSAEAAKALGVGALKMAHAFDRHFVKPEQEAKRARSGQAAPKKREFTIGDV
ncbi:hypothetical protein [Streptomyces sp. NPDC093111]|uniref:hypothetical protein n=1 Tax=Streptomyces sp. NPDC093111 TaxID=3154978 RepID=UPI0034269C5E